MLIINLLPPVLCLEHPHPLTELLGHVTRGKECPQHSSTIYPEQHIETQCLVDLNEMSGMTTLARLLA